MQPDSHLSEMELLTELQRRRMARRHLLDFTRFTKPDYETAPHHQRICEALEAVERGEIKRLMVSLPPRGGKSELVSRRFPCWVMGRNPGFEIIAASYGYSLAEEMSRDARQIVEGDAYARLFPDCRMDATSSAVDRWATSNGAVYRPKGVGQGITGMGADGLIIDDPVKDRAEADSELSQKRTWDWYRSTAYTRLSKNGWVIVCQTRWNQMDLSGMLIEQESMGGEQWHKLVIPAIDDAGASFWPERFPIERLDAIRSVTTGREWQSLYMQEPQPDEGTFFKREWFEPNRYTIAPTVHAYMTSDHARSQDGGDYTVLRVWGVDVNRDLYLLDGWRGQATTDVWSAQAIALIRKWKPTAWFPENDATWGSVEPFVRVMLRDANCALRIEKMSTRGDKPTKAQAFQGMAAQGRVHLPVGVVGDAVLSEYLAFPTGKHDDEVDAAAHMGRALMDAHPAILQTAVVKPSLDVWGRPRSAEGDWRAA